MSDELRSEAAPGITVDLLFLNPEEHIGKTVIMGGNIVKSTNSQEGTYIEVVEKALDFRGRPKHTDRSQGRFIIFHEGFLDSVIFSEDRNVTVAGEVLGKTVRPLGEIDYSYLLIKSREIHLVKPGERFPVQFGIGIGHTF